MLRVIRTSTDNNSFTHFLLKVPKSCAHQVYGVRVELSRQVLMFGTKPGPVQDTLPLFEGGEAGVSGL